MSKAMRGEEEPREPAAAPPEPAGARPVPVPLRQIWRWAAPWLGLAVLAATFLLGLFEARSATDDPDYIAGFVAAGLALLGAVWWLSNDTGHNDRPLIGLVTVERTEALVLVVAVLSLLAIGGLLLAARSPSGLLHIVGYALFGASLLLIAANLKHYFDVRE